MKMMQTVAMVCLISSSCAGIANGALEDKENHPHALLRQSASSSTTSRKNVEHRALQIIPAVCSLIGTLLPGNIECQCEFDLGLVFECAPSDPICIGPFCAAPAVVGSLALAPPNVFFGTCLTAISNNGEPLPGFCINFGGRLNPGDDEADESSGEQDAEDTKNNGRLIGGGGDGGAAKKLIARLEQTTANVETCTVTVEGQTCQACDICNDGHGYVFDCSEIDSRVVQSECTPLSILQSLNKDQVISFFPKLDSQK